MQQFGTYSITSFGAAPSGAEILKIAMTAPSGRSLEVLTLGAIVHRLWVPAPDGRKLDVVLGKENLSDYLSNGLCCSAVIGRYANRIGGAAYTYQGRRYGLEANYGPHCIHGGQGCYAGKVFAPTVTAEEKALCLRLQLLDCGQGGFPGFLAFSVTYRLENDRVRLIYEAIPTEDTPWSVTSHAYYDLNGHGSDGDHMLSVCADAYLPAAPDGVPTGEIRPLQRTAFDFRAPRSLQEALKSDDPQLTQFGGFDHTYCIRGQGLRQAAVLRGQDSGIVMEVRTDQPGMQLFTLNTVPQPVPGKDGKRYTAHRAVCLETQQYPNAVNEPGFPNPIIPAGSKSTAVTEWIFRR